MLNTSLYGEDLFTGSSESVNKVFDLSKNAIEILKDVNMNLRKFKPNSKELRKLWNENGIGDEKASNYKQFVSNRVIEIQSNFDPSDWHHCSGRENPADYVSRGANLETIINSQFWMHGPQWLRTTENNWPENLNCDFSSTDPCESEEQVFTCELNTASIINLRKFSSLQKLLRVTSWVLRFVHNIRNRFNKRSDDLSTEEIDGAEKFWIQLVQRDAFAEEVNCLRASKLLLKTSVILEFNPFLDSNELIRFGGRLQKSKFSYLQKPPIILPAKHYFVNLIVQDSHEKVFHGGVSETLLEIRDRRGLCSKILTDNAKTFKKSELELKNSWKVISDPIVKAFYAAHKSTGSLLSNEHPGGAAFTKDLFEHEFNEPEPLTPSHMILGRRVNSLPPARLNFDSNLSNRKVLIKSCQVIYSQFGLAIHQNDHQARHRFVEWAQNEIAVVPDFHKRILFSDEAHFWLNGYVNKQNYRIWSEGNSQVYVETPLHPEKLTVWCALWAGGILLQKR
ncbi:integrase_H2C2 domain-containing protein [Trichonephila clavipes]|nr:integrase_H2C2 domain-containing protein [Trichonephila clavipes]